MGPFTRIYCLYWPCKGPIYMVCFAFIGVSQFFLTVVSKERVMVQVVSTRSVPSDQMTDDLFGWGLSSEDETAVEHEIARNKKRKEIRKRLRAKVKRNRKSN